MGVWIETESGLYYYDATVVTPCMGVWIETFFRIPYSFAFSSHPVWVCGLKHFKRYLKIYYL